MFLYILTKSRHTVLVFHTVLRQKPKHICLLLHNPLNSTSHDIIVRTLSPLPDFHQFTDCTSLFHTWWKHRGDEKGMLLLLRSASLQLSEVICLSDSSKYGRGKVRYVIDSMVSPPTRPTWMLISSTMLRVKIEVRGRAVLRIVSRLLKPFVT